MLRYRRNVMGALAEHGYPYAYLSKNRIFAESTFTKFRHGVMVSTSELSKLCDLLRCQPGEIIEWVPDEEAEVEDAAQE